MTKQKKQIIMSWIPALIWMGVIFYLSHQPGTQSAQLSGSITEKIVEVLERQVPRAAERMDVQSFHFFIRKNAHFIAYFILSILVFYPMRNLSKFYPQLDKPYIYTFLFCVFYAMTDEFHQLFIPGRAGQLRDVCIDGLGAITALVLLKIKNVFVEKRRLRAMN